MFRRTSHCVCPPNSSFKSNPLRNDQSFQINNVSSDDFLMHSPPLPPRTIKNNFSSATKKYPSNKNTFSEWNDKTNCYDKTVQCNCSRPHSCPAEESSFILTPPIPPKTTCTATNTQGKSKNLKVIDEQVKKADQTKSDARKSSRHRNSEKPNNRKKSRSNSRSIARDDKPPQLGNNLEKISFLPENVEIRVNKYFTKNHDTLVEKNSQKNYTTKPNNELCKICENNEHALKFLPHGFPDTSQQSQHHQQQQQQQPDLIADRGATVASQHQKSCSNTKFGSKWKMKIIQLWSKSKKSAVPVVGGGIGGGGSGGGSGGDSNSSPVNHRDNAVTPENPPPHLLLQYPDDAPRPRRSKSLHLIPDSSLSPKTSMQLKSTGPTATDANITKHSGIFAVISPSTARWKRNFFCISPKTGSSSSKKSEYNLSMVSANNTNSANTGHNTGHSGGHSASANNNNTNNTNSNNSNSNNNCQPRNAPPSIAGGRISPVHLIATSSINNNNHLSESSRRDKDPLLSTSSNSQHSSAGKIVMMMNNQKLPQTRQEKSEVLNPNKVSCGSKTRIRIHQDNNLNKPSQSSSLNQPININNSPNQICPCHNYHYNDNHFSCNNAYSRFCTQFPCIHNNQSCQIYNIDSNPNVDIGPGCSQMCACVRNVVHFSPNHFYCCHPPNSNTVLCSSCRIPIFCTSCSYNCCNSNSKPYINKQSICHHSTSPPPCLSRQLPPPPPPPPATAFSSGHHYPRKSRQSYSKTPPPSFHTHPHSCHDDHCYQEYNLNFNHDTCQKLVANKSRTYNFTTTKSGCCCQKHHNNHCYMAPHSKCTGCGSFIYDELSTLSTHYNMSGFHKNQFSNTPAGDSLLEIKWRNTEQGLMNQCRLFTSSVNNEESANRFCHHNHCSNRHSGSCGHYSNEIKTPCCRNRDKLVKRRKSSSHSCHGSNIDQDAEEKCAQHELSRTRFNSPSNNLLPTNSPHVSPDLNSIIPNSDLSTANNNNLNINSTINMTSSTISAIQLTNLVDSNDKFEPWRKTFKENMLALRNLGWYWGPLNHLEAENLVENRPDGTFLVRDSAHDTYFLSLTFRVLGTTYHTRIEYSQGKFSFWSQPESHSATTIVEFIDKAVAHSASGKFHYFLQTSTPGQPPMEVSLLYPLSRYQIVQSLQHLARFMILSNIRKDHVSHLQLPQSLKSYLLEKQYYIDNIEAFVKLTKDAEPLVYEPSRNLLNNIQYNNNNINNNNNNNNL